MATHMLNLKAHQKLALLVLCSMVFISACASRPAIDGDTLSERQVSSALVQQHQASLTQVQGFSIQGSVAFFNDIDNSRDAARFNWQREEELLNFRLYHQLGGTLARIEQEVMELTSSNPVIVSTFINRDGDRFESTDLNWLLYQHTGMAIPFTLLNQAITGVQPNLPVRQQRWYPNGTIAMYNADLSQWHLAGLTSQVHFANELWQLQFGDYRLVAAGDGNLLLPHRIEATRDEFRVNIRINRWRPELKEAN